jgi:hypothetical protein
MGFLKNIVLGDPELKGMKYRIRVFDNGHHIKTADVVARGQRRIELVVKPKDFYFFGDEVKLAFMINPKIRPFYFGNIMEINFDVRDSTQLADLFDLVPDLVKEINETYYNTMIALKAQKEQIDNENRTMEYKSGKVIDADFTDNTAPLADNDPLTDPIPEKPEGKTPELSKAEQIAEKIPGVKTVTRGIDAVVSSGRNVSANIKGLQLLYDIQSEKDSEAKQTLMKTALAFCQEPGHEKCLRWLPERLHIEPEVMAVVSQIELDGVGIIPMYYQKQSAAEISEKMLSRPKIAEDWKVTAIIVIAMLVILVVFVFGLLKAMGRI